MLFYYLWETTKVSYYSVTVCNTEFSFLKDKLNKHWSLFSLLTSGEINKGDFFFPSFLPRTLWLAYPLLLDWKCFGFFQLETIRYFKQLNLVHCYFCSSSLGLPKVLSLLRTSGLAPSPVVTNWKILSHIFFFMQ